MSMSIDSMASMLNTTNTDATTNYNANALKKSLNGVSSDTSSDELMQVNTRDDRKRWWEVIDRSTGEVVSTDKWEYNEETGRK